MTSRFHRGLPFKWLFWERLLNKLIKLAFLSYVIAWLLTWSSHQTHVNVPIAVLLVLSFYWLSTRLLVPESGKEPTSSLLTHNRRNRRTQRFVRSDYYYKERVREPPDSDAWKKSINAPIVESAWEAFCGSIIQEWIYDAWYSMISPDREFPAEIRRMLNQAFAEVAQRARRIDIRTLLLRDMCDLFTEQLELYRSTKLGISVLDDAHLSWSKKDRAFQQEMKTNQTLHAAFYSRDGHYRMIRRIAEGVMGIIIDKQDMDRPVLRSLARELLATCVLRSVLTLFTPYNANKILLSLLKPKKEKRQNVDLPQGHDELQSEQFNGNFRFAQRVRTSVQLEELARKRVKQRQRLSRETALEGFFESKSQPNLASLRETTDGIDTEITEDGQTEISFSKSDDVDVAQLEETDLLAFAKNGGSGYEEIGTSLPLTPPSPLHRQSMTEPERKLSVIDRNVPVEKISFVGYPRARVVAPEINTSSGREYVVFKIRVADQSGEWTVTRRYRNFEALHKFLRDLPVYCDLRPKLPPKTLLFPMHKTEAVEQRRVALDRYLQTILSNEELAFDRHVWLFLSDQKCRFFTPETHIGFVKALANNMDSARHRIKRGVADTIGEGGSKVDLKKENALRLFDGSESSSVAGSVRNEDDTEPMSTSIRARLTSCDRSSHSYTESPYKQLNTAAAEGVTNLSINEGRKSPTPRKKMMKHVGFAPLNEADSEIDQPLLGDLSNPNMLSRFDFEDRDAIDRQVKENTSIDPATTTTKGPLCRTSSWRKIVRDASGSEDDDDSLESEFDDYSGISAPLYEVADAIFDFPAQKFFRRQVFQVMRQVLSFLAGDAIDVYLNEKIKRLRSQHTLARMIHYLKNMLWPGGVWFAVAETTESTAREPTSSRPKGLQSDSYLEVGCMEKDYHEVATSLEDRLFRHAPAALVRLVGRNSYMRSMKDVYDMLQLATFVRQIGYGVLEIGLLALFPELNDLFKKIHREARFMPESRR